jgi:hypothetical protein
MASFYQAQVQQVSRRAIDEGFFAQHLKKPIGDLDSAGRPPAFAPP